MKHSVTPILLTIIFLALVQNLQARNTKKNSPRHVMERRFSKRNQAASIKTAAKNNLARKKQKENVNGKSDKKKLIISERNSVGRKSKESDTAGRPFRKTGKGRLFEQKNKKPRQKSRSQQRQSDSTCSGTAVDSTCLDNLKSAMKYDRDQITNFKNQLDRTEDFHRLIGNKGSKNRDFSNSTTYLLIALGGNMTNLECSGNGTATEEATATYNTLANCSESVAAACAIPDAIAPNFTQLTECKTGFESIEKKNGDCLRLRSDEVAVCDCWQEAAEMVAESKLQRESGTCSALDVNKDMLSQKQACLKKFGACKKAEDASVNYIMTCAGSANLAFEDESGSNPNSEIRVKMQF